MKKLFFILFCFSFISGFSQQFNNPVQFNKATRFRGYTNVYDTMFYFIRGADTCRMGIINHYFTCDCTSGVDSIHFDPFVSGGGGGGGSGWSLTGNSGTDVSTDFVGPADTSDFRITTHGVDRIRLSQDEMDLYAAGTPSGNVTNLNFHSDQYTFYPGSGGSEPFLFLINQNGGYNYITINNDVSTDGGWTLPIHDGSNGEFLKTNGSGQLSFGSAGAMTPQQIEDSLNSSTNAAINFSNTVNLSSLTASRPLKLNSSKNIVSTQIDIASTNDVTGLLDSANIGTGYILKLVTNATTGISLATSNHTAFLSLSGIPNTSLSNSSFTLNGSLVSLGGTRTLSLASSDFVNQGTTTTLLHGNAAGNPSFGLVDSLDEKTDFIEKIVPIAPVTATRSGHTEFVGVDTTSGLNHLATQYYVVTHSSGGVAMNPQPINDSLNRLDTINFNKPFRETRSIFSDTLYNNSGNLVIHSSQGIVVSDNNGETITMNSLGVVLSDCNGDFIELDCNNGGVILSSPADISMTTGATNSATINGATIPYAAATGSSISETSTITLFSYPPFNTTSYYDIHVNGVFISNTTSNIDFTAKFDNGHGQVTMPLGSYTSLQINSLISGGGAGTFSIPVQSITAIVGTDVQVTANVTGSDLTYDIYATLSILY